MYHVLALQSARALVSPVPLSSVLGITNNSLLAPRPAVAALALPTELLFSVTDLESVTQTKTKTDAVAMTIMHLCGNKWCMNPGHFFVGTKVFNDDQCFCHRGLHNATSLAEYSAIQLCYCKHAPKCWALPYGGEYNLTARFCDTGIPVVVDEVE